VDPQKSGSPEECTTCVFPIILQLTFNDYLENNWVFGVLLVLLSLLATFSILKFEPYPLHSLDTTQFVLNSIIKSCIEICNITYK